jgi:hypothetical protein
MIRHYYTPRIIILLLILIWTSSVSAQQSQEIEAEVIALEGTVEAYRDESGQWETVEKGEKYSERDAISTAEDSWAELLFHNKHTMRMKENSEMTILQLSRRLDTGGQTTEISLSVGEVLNRVRELPTQGSIYTIHTPTATSSVRGTEFVVRTYEKEGRPVTEVQVIEGLVEVTDRLDQALEITDGQQAAISELGVPDAAEPMTPGQIKNLRSQMKGMGTTKGAEGGFESSLEESVGDLEEQVESEIQDMETIQIEEPPEIDQDDDMDDDLFK